jgi:hypothetical protein
MWIGEIMDMLVQLKIKVGVEVVGLLVLFLIFKVDI